MVREKELEQLALQSMRDGDLVSAHRSLIELKMLRPQDQSLDRRIQQVEKLLRERSNAQERIRMAPLRYAHAYIEAGRLAEGLQLLREAIVRDPHNQRLRETALAVARKLKEQIESNVQNVRAEGVAGLEAIEAEARQEPPPGTVSDDIIGILDDSGQALPQTFAESAEGDIEVPAAADRTPAAAPPPDMGALPVEEEMGTGDLIELEEEPISADVSTGEDLGPTPGIAAALGDLVEPEVEHMEIAVESEVSSTLPMVETDDLGTGQVGLLEGLLARIAERRRPRQEVKNHVI